MPRPTPEGADAAAGPWLRRIRLRHLEVLLAIARHGSLTAAATALDITQPAMSQWLADIESAAGARLFERGRRLRATPYAAPLLAHAERVLQDTRRTLAELQAIRAGGTGRVRIGAMSVASASLVPAAVLRLRERAPGIELFLVQDIAATLWSQLERDELDLLVTRLDARALGSGLPQRRLFSDQHRIVCRPGHPLAGRRRVAWRDAVRYPWVMPPTGTPMRDAIVATFAAAGVPQPPPMLTSTAIPANVELMRRSDALGVQSGAVSADHLAQGLLVALPLKMVHDIGDVGLVWREANPGPVLAAVLQAFVEAGAPGAAPAAAAAAR
ncbi:MAG: LysR substrate-binding domain-containing protein [Rubrivivax sp.]